MSTLDVLGSVGAFLIVLSYLLLQLGKLKSQDISYSVANAIGAALILSSLSEQFNLSAFIVEAFWFFVSLYGIQKAVRRTN